MRDFRDEMRRMHKRLNHWMKNFNEDPWDFEEEDFTQYRKAWVDARELEDRYVIAVELPGVNKEDIDVNINQGSLTIKVEKKSEEKSKDQESEAYSYSSSYSGFFRRIPIPENADTDKVEAEYRSGVLKLRIPKKAKKKKGKSIKIK